ncbi:Sister chromatid cohesion protein PDS5-like protein B-like [Oopsacas minuta]|uniref:Sister chromatid cohesion protein PDS5-like protein B-like n=1 Tax=Oopsacas minuta TaxID=111878 RepID=A0AAV7KID9_9METZ|nr:Sister chromatid cohesion protein PDS5-like protein B-like [Oopsacas minuta]
MSQNLNKLKNISPELSPDELVNRLQSLELMLGKIDQQEGEIPSSITSLSSQLIDEDILNHKDRQVRFSTAICLGELFRICCPQPPFSLEALKSVFHLLLIQLRGLSNPKSSQYEKLCYLVETIAEVKCCLLCLDVEGGNEIVLEIFQTVFMCLHQDQGKRIQGFLLEILHCLLQESENLPDGVLETMLQYLVEPLSKERPVANKMIGKLLDKSFNQLEQYIRIFFNNWLVTGTNESGELSAQMYELLYQLHLVQPQLVTNVLPQLEVKVKGSEVKDRLDGVQVLTKLLSARDYLLARSNKSLWQMFLSRFRDIDPKVRLLCLQSCKQFYKESELLPDLIEQWNERHCDSEEAIRREVIKLVSMVLETPDRYTLLSQEGLTRLCDILRERMLDKKWQVRKTAMTSAAVIHLKIWSSGETLEKIRISATCVEWVLEKLLHQYYQPFNQDKCYVTNLIIKHLFPVIHPPTRYLALVTAFRACNENAVLALTEILRKRMDTDVCFRNVVDPKTPEAEKIHSIDILSRYVPESEHLKTFLDMIENDRKLAKNIRELLKQNLSVEASLKVRDQILSQIGTEHKCYIVARSVMDISVSPVIDKEGITLLLNYVWDDLTEDNTDGAESTLKLIKLFLQNNPTLLPSQESLNKLLQLCRTDEHTVSLAAVELLAINAGSLKNSSLPVLSQIQSAMISFATQSVPCFAKHAVKYLSIACKDSHSILHKVLMRLREHHMDFEDDKVETAITSFGCIALFEPQIYTNKLAKEIFNKFMIKEIISKDRESPVKGRRGRNWEVESKLSREVQIKLCALKAVMRWMLGCEDREDSKMLPCLKLFCDIIENEGDLMNQGCLLSAEKAYMRLKASTCLLKLGTDKECNKALTYDQWYKLSTIITDPCQKVREIFIRKLTKDARSLHLPPQYTSLFCLSALDINIEVYKFAKQQFQRCITFRKQLVDRIGEMKVEPALILPEYILPYVIHLLAYDEELSGPSPDAIKKAEKCLWFTLEPIVQKTNRYPFFMKLLNTIKSTNEAVLDTPESTERLHSMCDLVGKILATKVHQISTEQYRDPILLPKHLYKQSIIPPEGFMEEPEIISPIVNHSVMNTEDDERSVNGTTIQTTQQEDIISHTPIEEPTSAQDITVDTDITDSIQEPDISDFNSSLQIVSGRKRRRTPSDALTESFSSSSNSDKSTGVRKSQRKRM